MVKAHSSKLLQRELLLHHKLVEGNTARRALLRNVCFTAGRLRSAQAGRATSKRHSRLPGRRIWRQAVPAPVAGEVPELLVAPPGLDMPGRVKHLAGSAILSSSERLSW